MGRGSSGANGGRRNAGGQASNANNAVTGAETARKTLVSKSQLNDLTADYTPEMFLGNVDQWTGSINDAENLARDNMPQKLEIGGYTFNRMGDPHGEFITQGNLKNNVVVLMDYQSPEMIGNEYPIVQVGVRIRRYRNKVQTEIIRDNPTFGTKFW